MATESTEATEATEATTEETEPKHGPFSTPVVTERPVDINGQLRVENNTLVNEAGEKYQLRGMSLSGINITGTFFNPDTCQTLSQDWGCNVVRIAMYTLGSGGGKAYIADPEKFFTLMCEDIDICVEQGIYCIVDWHILFDGDPLQYKDEAVDFFSRISAIYCDCPNVIYEICNEPNGESLADPDQQVGWENCIKPYADEVIAAIRANDPDNIILVGTPNWSQYPGDVLSDPIDDPNVMYTIHFYAASHGQEFRDRYQEAADAGVPLFASEWGTSADSGGGIVDFEASDVWLDFLDSNNISWCNWSIGSSVSESSNALKMMSDILDITEKHAGHWPDEFISRSGLYVRSKLLGIPYVPEEN